MSVLEINGIAFEVADLKAAMEFAAALDMPLAVVIDRPDYEEIIEVTSGARRWGLHPDDIRFSIHREPSGDAYTVTDYGDYDNHAVYADERQESFKTLQDAVRCLYDWRSE